MTNDCPRMRPTSGTPPTRHASRRTAFGFTLIELMIVVSIIAILAGLAAPSFSSLIAGQRARAAATNLNSALLKARSEAIKRNTNVTLSPNTAGDWQSGWQILDPADAARRLEQQAAFTGVAITGPADVTFQNSGRVRGTTLPTFDITAPNTSDRWCGTVELSGRSYLKKSPC